MVNLNQGPHNGENPPPNDGNSFNPPERPGNPNPPGVGLIVKLDDEGRWGGVYDYLRSVPMTDRAALYEAIVEVTGKAAVADSSKKPNRAFALAQSERLELKVLHLVRDGRGVVWSQLKPRKQDVEGGIPVDHVAAPAKLNVLSHG